MGVLYDPESRTTTPILSAYAGSHPKHTNTRTPPWGINGVSTMELTGGYDMSAALRAPVPYTPQV